MSLRNKKKKWLAIIWKGFMKQPVIEQSTTFLSFPFLIDYCMSVFSLSLLSTHVSKFWKIYKILSIKVQKFENTDRNILPKTYSF